MNGSFSGSSHSRGRNALRPYLPLFGATCLLALIFACGPSTAPTTETAATGPVASPTPLVVPPAIAAVGESETAPVEKPAFDVAMPGSGGAYDKLAVLYVGRAHANLEVCGCKKKQMGGVAPRAGVIREARAEPNTHLLLLEAGRFMVPGDELDRKRCEVYLESLDEMAYDAVALSASDFAQGYAFLEEMSGKVKFPFLSCNLKNADGSAGFWKSHIIKDYGDTKVAILGFTDPHETIDGGDRQLTASDPVPILAELIKSVSDQVDVVIAMGSSVEALGDKAFFDMAGQLPGLDFLIGAIMNQPPRTIGGTTVLACEQDGKQIGRIDVNVFPNGELYHKSAFIDLPKGMEMEPNVRALLDDFYQTIRTDPKYSSKVKDLYSGLEAEADPDNAYVGVELCKSCHLPQYNQWSLTGHAHAHFTLLTEGVKKYYVPECLNCHTTGYGLPTGFGNSTDESLMREVSCEVCHGPGKKHVDTEGKGNIRKTVDKAFCERCHDTANDEHFQDQFNSRWNTILHRATRFQNAQP